MKCNLMFGSLVLAMLSTHALATEIHHGKLINHKEWSDAKIKGFVKEAAISGTAKSFLQLRQLKLKKTFLTSSQNGDGIWAADRVDATTVTPGTNNLSGVISAYIENFTTSQQTYNIHSYLCVINFEATGGTASCYGTQDTVSLDPNGYILLSKQPAMSYDFVDTTSTYFLSMYTSITRSGMDTVFATSSAAEINFADNQQPRTN